MTKSSKRVLHKESGLYCEHGLGPYKNETHLFFSDTDNVPMQICKSALEVSSFLGGYSRAFSQYLPSIIAAVALAPKDSPVYKILNDIIYRDSSYKTNETRLIFDSWTCIFCGDSYTDRTLAIKHAIGCDENEDNHTCATCASYAVGHDTIDGYKHICNGNKDRVDTWMVHCPEWIGK